VRAPVPINRRCGLVAAWSSVRGPVISVKSFQENPFLSLRKALSERLKAGDVVLVDDLKLASPKTKDFVGLMSTLELTGTTLIVAPADKNLTLASRNIENVTLATSDSLNTYDILRPDKLLFTKSAFERSKPV